MKKKYAKIKLIIIAVMVVIGLCLTVFAFDIPGGSDRFLGFIGAMDTSAEIGESYKVTFTVDRSEDDVENSDINEGIEIIYGILTDYTSGYSDIRLVRSMSKGEEQIIAYVPNDTLTETFYDLFGEAKKLEGKTASGAVVIKNENIKAAQYTQDENGNYGVYIQFDSEGTAALIKYEEDITYTIDGESATGRVLNNMLFIYNDTIKASINEASKATISLVAGKLPFKVSVSTTTIDALVGINTKLYLKIATGIMLACYIAYMVLRHRFLGLVSLLSAGIYFVVYCFVVQSISITSLQLASFVAMIVAFIIFAIGIEYQLEKMENHFANGKKIPVSIKYGYKDSLFTLMDLHVTAFIVALVVLILGSRIIKAVSINLICGIIISTLLTMVVNKYFVKLLCDIYPKDKDCEKFNFKREEE